MLRERATNCAKLWNEATYQRRQAYLTYQTIDWKCGALYNKYSPIIDSATAQQVLRENNDNWKGFFALKRLERRGKLPPNIKTVHMPGYWKRNGKYRLMMILRNDCYKIKNEKMRLPKKLKVPIKGNPKWSGKQGKAEIIYDILDCKWRVFQAVKVQPLFKPKGSKTCYIDLGIINLATMWIEEWKQPIAYSGRNLLADWWYWTQRIATCQSRLEMTNGRRSSKRLSRLHRIRQRRFRQAINTMVRTIVRDLYELDVSKIVVGDLTGIRENNYKGAKSNSMIHNFWSFNYIIQRFKDVAEEYCINVRMVSERKTSSICIRCGSENFDGKGRLFKCKSCGLEANRDAIGVLNMANLYGGTAIRVLTHPNLLRWNGMKWERNSAMTHEPMNIVEARISRL